MEPKILEREPFVVIGTITQLNVKEDNIGIYESIWQKFESYHSQIKPYSIDQAYYGVSFPTDKEGIIDYLAGMSIDPNVPFNTELISRKIEAARFAVFACPVENIGIFYQSIFGQWLPNSKYDINSKVPVFEQYPPEGDRESPVHIHIPVEEKETVKG